MPQQPDLISLYVAPLNRTGIEYMVTGAVAAIVYGEPRLTNDIDVVIALQPPDVPGLTAGFAEQDIQDNQIDLETIATQVRRLGLEDEWQAVGLD